MSTTPLELSEQLQSLSPSALIVLYSLDTTPTGDDSIIYFHNGTNGMTNPIVFDGVSYTPLPISVSGFQHTTGGQMPRPTMIISNLGGWLSSVLLSTNDLIGAKVTRRRTFAKYLDGMPDAQVIHLPDDIYYVGRKVREDRLVVELELQSSLDMEGVLFPTRQITSGYCPWIYRGDGCFFADPYVVTDRQSLLQTGAKRYRGRWNATDTYIQEVVEGQTEKDSVGYPESGTDPFGVYEVQEASVTGSANSPANAPSKWKQVQKYRGVFDETISYDAGDVVSLASHVDGTLIFALAKWDVPVNTRPPNSSWWATDFCAKFSRVCKYRFDPFLYGNPLPYGGFPGTINVPDL